MNLFEGVEVNWTPIIAPIIILIITMFVITFLYKMLFSWLPKKLYDALIGPVMLGGIYIWAIPMNLGFHELFK